MITKLVSFLCGWWVTALLGALLAVGGYAGAQTYRLHSAQTELAQLQASVAEADAKAQSAARTESERRDTSSSSATQTMLDYLGRNLPTIEATSHDTIERIRTVYRDRPVPAVCQWDERVRDELEAARVRANAANGTVRPAPVGNGPTHSEH